MLIVVAPAAIAVMGGHTSILLGNVSEAAPYVEAGRLRAIAVTSLTRSDVVKDVPTLHESGYPGYEATNWFGAVTRTGAATRCRASGSRSALRSWHASG